MFKKENLWGLDRNFIQQMGQFGKNQHQTYVAFFQSMNIVFVYVYLGLL